MSEKHTQAHTERPPVVAILGHVDHGKSTLLDTIRKTNVVDGESGGITQHLSTYEVIHTSESSEDKKITFIDTPGHAAFSAMRHRSTNMADIAILIVSAEDGVKAQTVEAIETIKTSKVPFIVAINKIDRPNANQDKVKTDLLEHGVYVEGYGGDIPFVPISAKMGDGIDDLLAMILLVAELSEFTGDPSLPATGFVIESHRDERRGVSATLIIKNGTLSKGDFVVTENSMSSTRIFESFDGTTLETATFSAPIVITGFGDLPATGTTFSTTHDKRAAEKLLAENLSLRQEMQIDCKPVRYNNDDDETTIIPIIIKTDVAGTADAIEKELESLSIEDVIFKIIKKDVGSVNESDFKLAYCDAKTAVVGFHVPIESSVKLQLETENIAHKTFEVIYEIPKWIEEHALANRKEKEIEEIIGSVTLLKKFSATKKTALGGGRVESGRIAVGDSFRIKRGDEIIGHGKIDGLQQGKMETKEVQEGNEFGAMLTTGTDFQPMDILEVVTKRMR